MTPTRIVHGVVPPPANQRAYPLTDEEAWGIWGRDFAHLFDRMWIARSQGLLAEPHGVTPPEGRRVFSRPLMNLRGMGMGARLIEHWSDADYTPGHFWMEYLEGPHWSDDYVFEGGRCVWTYRVHCEKDEMRVFIRFDGGPESGPYHGENLAWLARYLPGYTGVVNVETIGGKIIEVHLRPNSDYLTFYGSGWLERVQGLYVDGRWGPVPQGQSATVIPVRVQKGIFGNRFRLDKAVLEDMHAALIALEFSNDVPLVGEPDDGWTWRLALVGDPNPGWAEQGAQRIAEAIEATDPPPETKRGI